MTAEQLVEAIEVLRGYHIIATKPRKNSGNNELKVPGGSSARAASILRSYRFPICSSSTKGKLLFE